MISLRNRLRHVFSFFLATAFLAAAPATDAQDIGSSVVTAALGVPGDEDNDPAVYLTWWPTGDATWSPQRYAVYSKDGAPGDSAPFELVAIVEPQVDVIAVNFSLNRSLRVGEDLDALSNNIDGLYDKIVPTAGMQLAEKLAAIVAVSEFDPESAETLALLTRRHPAAALVAGVGFIDSIPEGQIRTYEIRSCPPGAAPGDCDFVSGRVVVEGGKITYLPAPGEPVHVPFVDDDGERDPRGNLNVPLRWATPDPLRERSFFQFGYDVFRVDPATAKDENWDTEHPDRDDFLEFLNNGSGAVQQINVLPILADELFSPANVADLNADPRTYFVIDDNGRYEPGGEPFQDGDTYFYFVAGRDLLGRTGEISIGTPVTVCFRIPPASPRGLEVTNHYSWDAASDTQTQVFKVTWNEVAPLEHGPEIAGYWIYRWESIEEMHQMQGLPFSSVPNGSLTGGRVATVPAGVTEYIDNVGPHPFITYSREGDLETAPIVNDDEANKTYWYTVRAIDASACGANVSGNSAPAYGVLRGRVGPDAPGGHVGGVCADPIVDFQRFGPGETNEEFVQGFTYLEIGVDRFDEQIAWAEFFIEPLADKRSYLGHFEFTGNRLVHSVKLRNDRLVPFNRIQARLFVRVGTADGKVSETATGTFYIGIEPDPQTGQFVQLLEFAAMLDRKGECDTHETNPDPTASGLVNPIQVTLNLTPRTEEWKLYRRIGNGSISMLRQGIGRYEDDPIVTVEDSELPLNGGQICYFLQVFDRHGNPSVLQRIGCITATPRTPLPAPMLSPVQPLGEDPAEAGARVKWFAPPGGVERFEIWIRSDVEIPAQNISGDLRLNVHPELDPDFSLRYIHHPSLMVFRSYVTGRVGANFSSGPEFHADWTENLQSGIEYTVAVRAVGAGGSVGPWSNIETFIWSSEIDFSQPFDPGDCVVPWPVRGLPGVNADFPVKDPSEPFEIGLLAEIFPKNPDGSPVYSGGAVRVGKVRLGRFPSDLPKNWDRLPGPSEQGLYRIPYPREGDLRNVFYQTLDGTPLLNFMLFRYQVPNDIWPSVSGDVYQVSPLIEGIAHTDIEFEDGPAKAIHDPYFMLIEIPESNPQDRAFHLFLKDTQPVINGASYRYLVVRFDDSGEIAQVIPLPTVTAN